MAGGHGKSASSVVLICNFYKLPKKDYAVRNFRIKSSTSRICGKSDKEFTEICMDKKNRFSKWFSLGEDKPLTNRQFNILIFCLFLAWIVVQFINNHYQTKSWTLDFKTEKIIFENNRFNRELDRKQRDRHDQNAERRHKEIMQLIKTNCLTDKSKGGGK